MHGCKLLHEDNINKQTCKQQRSEAAERGALKTNEKEQVC